MTGKEKIQSAFSRDGTGEVPAVICYDGLYYRDHWPQLTSAPWWHIEDPDVRRQAAWRSDAIRATPTDWFEIRCCHTRDERDNLYIEPTSEGAFLVDRASGARRRLVEPFAGGWHPEDSFRQPDQSTGPKDRDEIDRAIPSLPDFDRRRYLSSGQGDLAIEMFRRFGKDRFAFQHMTSPLWACNELWGYEGLMMQLCDRPDLVRYACERLLRNRVIQLGRAAAVGVEGIWIEEAFTDSISPEQYARFNVPVVRHLTEAIGAMGMKSILYYCGNPHDRWDLLLECGADALSLEESKKNFGIDIEDVVARINGRCAVLGNLDAIGLLPHAREDRLRAEIARQIAAGRKNGGRFIMSVGSPITPETSTDRVRLYFDIVRES